MTAELANFGSKVAGGNTVTTYRQLTCAVENTYRNGCYHLLPATEKSPATGKPTDKPETTGAASVATIKPCEQPAMDGQSIWHLSFKAADAGDPPIAIRVRRLLKRALRSFGLRCVDYRVDPPAATATPARPIVETRL